MSFLNNIFGSKSKMHTSLVINDEYLETVQIEGGKNSSELVGINRINLDEGIVKGGEIMRESAFQNALRNLFESASPNPIQPEGLCINIPFDQLYSFVKPFSKHTHEELMHTELKELLINKAPFDFNDLQIKYSDKVYKNKVFCGLTAYPKRWEKMVREACGEIGFKDLHFFVEPEAQISIAQDKPEGNFVLFSWLNGNPYLSVFYHSLLYDSYLIKYDENTEDLMREFDKESKSFQDQYKEKIESVYFAGFPEEKRTEVKKLFNAADLSVTYLRESETPISKVIPVEKFSSTLVGLALKAYEI